MKDYGAISPMFWTGETGKELRQLGPECQLLALYLVTNTHRNALGIYYLPIPFIAHETGLPLEGASKPHQRGIEGASKTLRRVCDTGFCVYDEDTEMVWIYNMAREQIGELKEKDKRVSWINKIYDSLPKCPFLKPFFDKYAESLWIKKARDFQAPSKGLRRGFDAPSKPDSDSDSDSDSDTDNAFSSEKAAQSADPSEKKISKHYSHHLGEYFRRIRTTCLLCDELSKKNGRKMNLHRWVQQCLKKKIHPGAICEAAEVLVKRWNEIEKTPDAYLRGIIKVINGNYNEHDAIRIHNDLKQMDVKVLKDLTNGLFTNIE